MCIFMNKYKYIHIPKIVICFIKFTHVCYIKAGLSWLLSLWQSHSTQRLKYLFSIKSYLYLRTLLPIQHYTEFCGSSMLGETFLLVDPAKSEGTQINQKKLQMKSPTPLFYALSALQYSIKKEAIPPKIVGGREFEKTISLALLATPSLSPKNAFYHSLPQTRTGIPKVKCCNLSQSLLKINTYSSEPH